MACATAFNLLLPHHYLAALIATLPIMLVPEHNAGSVGNIALFSPCVLLNVFEYHYSLNVPFCGMVYPIW